MSDLSVVVWLMMMGSRLFIPKAMWEYVLKRLHEGQDSQEEQGECVVALYK